jgi:hypothetical protein
MRLIMQAHFYFARPKTPYKPAEQKHYKYDLLSV